MAYKGFQTDKPVGNGAPKGEVEWLLRHRDGRCQAVKAQTAFVAAQKAGWTMSEVEEFERTDVKWA